MTAAPTAQAAGTIDVGGDLTVNRMGFGAMRITGDGIWGPPLDRDEAERVLRRAIEVGITFIDTADSYGPEVSEEIIAETLYPYPDDLVIATKGGLTRSGPASGGKMVAPSISVKPAKGACAACVSTRSPCTRCTAPIRKSHTRSRWGRSWR